MPAPDTAIDFLDMVRKSGLVPPERTTALLVQQANAGEESVERLASAFVRAGLLTFFQAKQLKQGRYKRFQIAGKYRLLELLGVGGMGAVYLCEHEYMKRLVAVKVLPLDKLAADPSALQRFYREARAVAALNHPNVVQAYDIDKFDTVHFLVMEYVDGSSLQDIVARYAAKGQFFDPVRAAHYVAQAAAGIQHAAELGLVHRDVKPGNLLLDRSGVIKVLDMGLARFHDHRHDGLTERFDDQCVLGTADYLAPEQAMHQTADVRADIYGLGGTLYFLLTGRTPFPDGNIAQKLIAHQTQEPRPVSEFRPDVPPDLLRVLGTMMRKDPDRRYQTPNEVIRALQPWVGQPIGPPPAEEMPVLSPAVLELIGQNPLPGRADSSVGRIPGLRAAGLNSSSVHPLPDVSQAMVPTRRNHDTTRMHPAGPPAPAGWPSRSRLALVALGSFASALILLLALYQLVR